jgi:vacuolar-type H+-ATPase subunit E/Vma4
MENKGSEKGVRELFGTSLKNVKDGERILSFMEKLAAERDALEERQQHLTSLTRLFEKTIYDADELAEQIKKEAEEKAKTEAEAILGQADEKIEQILKDKKLETVKEAEAEAREIRDRSAKEFELTLRKKKSALQSLFKNYSERLYNEMLAQTESFRQQAALLEMDIENSLAELSIPGTPAVSSEPGKEANDSTAQITSDAEIDMTLQQLMTGDVKSADVSSNKTETGLERMEVEILPPRDKDAMEAIAAHLSSLEEVAAVDLRHLTDKTVVEIVLNRNIDIIQALSELSQVEQIQEVIVGGQKKIQIILSVHGELEKAKDILNTRANRIASRRG